MVILQPREEKSLWATELEGVEVEYHVPGEADVYGDEIRWKWARNPRMRFNCLLVLMMGISSFVVVYAAGERAWS